MFSQEKAEQVCQLVADGASLRRACTETGVNKATFLLWCKERSELADQYARARETGMDAEFEDLAAVGEEEPERDDKGRIDAGWVQWKRLQIDAKKWALSKKAPKKYGDKLDLNHSGAVRFEKIEAVIVDPKG